MIHTGDDVGWIPGWSEESCARNWKGIPSLGPLHRMFDREPEKFVVHQQFQIHIVSTKQGKMW